MYNVADEKGYLENRPSWLGSWLLMPISLAQLFHAFVFDRETTPKVGHTILLFFFFFWFICLRDNKQWFGELLIRRSQSYIRKEPDSFPGHWPSKYEVVDSLATIAKLRWP